MSTVSEIRIGDRIRFYRQAQSKTQAVVAGLAGVTEDYLSQIERGLKTPTIGLVHKFARILRVRVADLLGEPEPEHDGGEHPIGRAVSAALLSYGTQRAPRAADEIDNVDASGLRRHVDHGWSIWQKAARRYSELSRVIPKLIVDVERTRRSVAGTAGAAERRVLHRIASDLYFLLRSFTRRIGRTDLSILVTDRAIAAAEDADDPLRIAAARWNLGHVLLAQGEEEGAVEVTVKAAEDVGRAHGVDAGDAAAIQGALSLVQAMATVRGGDAGSARDIIRERAWPMARRTGEGNVMWTVFGPTNVRLHAVSIEMETGHTAEALRLADQIDVNGVDSLERRTTFALEVARCYEQKRDDAAVLVHLVIAEGSGPEDLRYNPLARDLVHGLAQAGPADVRATGARLRRPAWAARLTRTLSSADLRTGLPAVQRHTVVIDSESTIWWRSSHESEAGISHASVPGIRHARVSRRGGAGPMVTQDPLDSGKLDWIWDGRLAGRGYSDADLHTFARVLSRTCPHCGAGVSAYCRNAGTGTPITDLDRQHVARRGPWRG